MADVKITTPVSDEAIASLKAGDRVSITGVLYTARDAAHKRLLEAREKGEPLPIDLRGQIIYYVGPSPAKPGYVVGSAGPTTASRMDIYTPAMLEMGVKGTIGKGERGPAVKEALKKYKGVYFGAVGGLGVYLSKRIKKAEVVAYSDLGPEAVRRLEVVDFPVIVVNDMHGGDLMERGKAQYKKEPQPGRA